jgi:AIPR protein
MPGEIKKTKARDELIRFAEDETQQKFHKLSGIQQSHELTRFYIKEIHNRIKTEVSDDDLELAIVDGGSDLGCDLIHRDDNQVLIIQSKYRSSGNSEKPEEVSHFRDVLGRLLNRNLRANQQVLDQISTIDWANDRFRLVFITLGSLKNQAGELADTPPNYPPSFPDLADRCEWLFLDEGKLNDEFRNAVAYERGPSEKMIKLFPEGDKGKRGTSSVIRTDASGYQSYIMALDANQIVNAYRALEGEALFSLNIRNFIGNTSTNKKIIDTAKDKPDSFFLFNNGISCLCNKLESHPDRLEVTGLQVINGAQTVKALVNVVSNARGTPPQWANGAPKVLVRITEIPGGYGSSGTMRESITQFNNTQNVIKVSDFRSNDAVQLSLKDQFAKLKYDGKQVNYQPKRTDKKIRNSEVVRFEEFAKTIFAFLVDPVSFSGATSFLFDDQGGGYRSIFGDGTKVWETMPEEEFRLRAAIYWLTQKFTKQMKSDRLQETDPESRAAIERKWMLMYASRRVFEHYYPNRWKAQLARAYRGDWEMGSGTRGKIFLQIYKDAKAGVVMTYKNSKRNNHGFVHRNWMRSKDTPGQISEVLRDVVLILRDPIQDIPESVA